MQTNTVCSSNSIKVTNARSLFRFHLYAILIILFSSCGHPHHWSIQRLPSSSFSYQSSKLTYRSYDKVNGIDLEIVKDIKEVRFYLIVHSQSIPPYESNAKEALVKIGEVEKEFIGIGMRHAGGQCIQLQADLIEPLLFYLNQEKPFQISLQGYATIIDPHRFRNYLSKLQRNFIIPNPLHLQF